MFVKDFEKLLLLVFCQVFLFCRQLLQISFLMLCSCIITNDVDAGICSVVRLFCKCLLCCLVVVEVVLRMQGHFFIAPADRGFCEADIKAWLLEEDSSNNEGAVELLVIDCALHLLALSGQGQFWKHNVVETDTLGAGMWAISSARGNWIWQIKQFHVLWKNVSGCCFIR